MKRSRSEERYLDTHRPRDVRSLDLDWAFGAHVPPMRKESMACEKCVWGSGYHRTDCTVVEAFTDAEFKAEINSIRKSEADSSWASFQENLPRILEMVGRLSAGKSLEEINAAQAR